MRRSSSDVSQPTSLSRAHPRWSLLAAAVLVGGGVLTTAGAGWSPAVLPDPDTHVLVVMLETKGYAGTLGKCSADPYLCSLGAADASVTGWTGVRHPSQPDYFAATMGGTQGCTSDTCFATLSVPSLGGQLTAAAVPWTAYMESMPKPCYTGQWYGGTGSGSGALYAEKHDPFVVVKDVLNNGCSSHVLPYPGASGLIHDLSVSIPPKFVWITPNQQNDMHTGTAQMGDKWLKTNIAPVLASAWFTNSDTTVVISMDEHNGDNVGGGGSIPMVVVSHNASGSGNVAMKGNHYGLLRSIERAFGLPLLGAAGQAGNGDLTALFGGL